MKHISDDDNKNESNNNCINYHDGNKNDNTEIFNKWILGVKSHESNSLDKSISAGLYKFKKRKIRATLLRTSVAAILVILVGFSVLVNTSYAFAESIIKIPPLRAIAKLVAMDPTLKAALNNDYIQLVGKTQDTENGYLSIHYIVADAQQLTVFVTEKNIDFNHNLVFDSKTNKEILCSSGMTRYVEDPKSGKEELFGITYDIVDGYELSDTIQLDYILKDSGKTLSFNIDLDKKFKNNLVDYKINKTANVAGQLVNLDKIRISPTKARLFFTVDPSNTAYIKRLNLALKDENGKIWNTESNGLSGYFNQEGTDLNSIMLESTYFSKPKHLTLEISGYEFVTKSNSKFIFDFDSRKFESLPDFVKFKEVTSRDGKLTIILTSKIGEEDNFGQIFSFEYTDMDGEKQHIISQGMSSSHTEDSSAFIEIEDLKSGKATFTQSDSPQQKIEPIVVPIY